MMAQYAIRIYKQHHNFSASHFMLFDDGTREPLHGHNYKVALTGRGDKLGQDMLFDFLDIKPIVREVCKELDHKLLVPQDTPMLQIEETKEHYQLHPKQGAYFSIPKEDVLILPIQNTSAERLAMFIAGRIQEILMDRFDFKFAQLEVEVEETPGQAAVYSLVN
jgi:6-pyruvoyltetrahydropterin/6-carboxytetrahydropterin synthase